MSIFLQERLLFSRLFRHGIERIGKPFCDRARTIFVFVKNGGVRVSVLWFIYRLDDEISHTPYIFINTVSFFEG